MVYCVNNLDTTGLCWKQAVVSSRALGCKGDSGT